MAEPTVTIVNFGDFKYVYKVHEQLSAEILLEHLMRSHAHSVKLGIADTTATITRDIKDDLIKDNRVI